MHLDQTDDPRPAIRRQLAVVITPIGNARFMVRLGSRVILESSRQPLLDAARALLAEGTDPKVRIQMRHEGSPHVALSSTVGKAAKLEVKDDIDGPRFVSFYARRQARRQGAPARLIGEPVPNIAPESPDALFSEIAEVAP